MLIINPLTSINLVIGKEWKSAAKHCLGEDLVITVNQESPFGNTLHE